MAVSNGGGGGSGGHSGNGGGFASLHEDDEDDVDDNGVNNSEEEDDDDRNAFDSSYGSAVGAATTEHHVIRHIDRNILACQICQGRYREPKVLPCLHTFCLCCLGTYLPPESLAITCPLCGQQSILPQKGVSVL